MLLLWVKHISTHCNIIKYEKIMNEEGEGELFYISNRPFWLTEYNYNGEAIKLFVCNIGTGNSTTQQQNRYKGSD